MEIFTAAIGILQKIVLVIGGGMAVIGAIQLFQAWSDNNGAQKQMGMAMLIAGGGIVLVAQQLIPMLANLG